MHIAECETLKNAPNPKYFNNEDRYSYFKRTSFTLKEWKKIKNIVSKIILNFYVHRFQSRQLIF